MIRSTNAAVRELLPRAGPHQTRVEEEAAPHLEEPAGHDVVEHAHALEERDVLEGAGDAEGGHVGRRQARAVAAVEERSGPRTGW